MATQLTSVVDDVVLVEYFHFALQTFPSPTVVLDLGIPEDLVRGGQGGATFRSAATDHYAPVRIELWPAPPPAAGSWHARQSTGFTADTVALRLMSPTAGVSDLPLLLPVPGEYAIRAHVDRTGPIPPPRETTFLRGLERWLVQIWPL
jgi:hypothetical protein